MPPRTASRPPARHPGIGGVTLPWALLLALGSGCGQVSYGTDAAPTDGSSRDAPWLDTRATPELKFPCNLRNLSEFSPTGKQVLLFCKKGELNPSRLYRVDVATGSLVGSMIELPGKGASDYVPIDDDTGYVLQHANGTATSGALYRFDISSQAIENQLLSNSLPMLLGVLDPAGGWLYTNEHTNRMDLPGAAVRKFSTVTDQPAPQKAGLGMIKLGQMFVGAGGTRLLAINKAWEMVSVFDTGSMSLVANIHVGFTGDTHAAISHDGKTLAVLSSGVGIRLIDTATLRVVDTLPVTDPTSAVAFSADGRRLYLGNGAVVDIKARAVVARLAYGATNVETSRDGRYLLAENALNMTLRVIMLR